MDVEAEEEANDEGDLHTRQLKKHKKYVTFPIFKNIYLDLD